jgi:hypothetical protein
MSDGDKNEAADIIEKMIVLLTPIEHRKKITPRVGVSQAPAERSRPRRR